MLISKKSRNLTINRGVNLMLYSAAYIKKPTYLPQTILYYYYLLRIQQWPKYKVN